MEQELMTILSSIREPKKIFIACAIVIFSDIITGYLKAFKLRKVNSSISRDGYIKKIGWIYALFAGVAVKVFIGPDIVLIGTAAVCISTELISIRENLGEIGINLPHKQYFEKLKDSKKE